MADTNEKRAVAYLLGDLSETDCAEFEQKCLDDDGFFEELLAREAELTDDYVQGGLTGREREAFARRLLISPERAREVELARLITSSGETQSAAGVSVRVPESRTLSPLSWLNVFPGFPRASFAFASLLLVVITGLLVWKNHSTSTQQAQKYQVQGQIQGHSQDQSSPDPMPRPEEGPAEQPVILAFALQEGSERGSGTINEIAIPAGTDRINFKVALPSDESPTYRASLKMVGGPAQWTLEGLKASSSTNGKTLVIELSATSLPKGDSILAIAGSGSGAKPEVVGRYFIRRLQ